MQMRRENKPHQSRWMPRWRVRASLGIDNKSSDQLHASRFDTWLLRLSHISQVGLVIVAIFGYFYTVVPLYQKSVLEEQIAEKEIELNAKTKALADVTLKLDTANSALAQASADLEKSYTEVRRYTVNQFIFLAGAECSGLLMPASKPLRLRDPPVVRKSEVEQLLAIDLGNCLAPYIQGLEKKNLLRAVDLKLIRDMVQRIIPKWSEKRLEITRRYRQEQIRTNEQRIKLKKEYEARLTDAMRRGDATRMFKILSSNIDADLDLGSKETALAVEYGDYLRSLVQSIGDPFRQPHMHE